MIKSKFLMILLCVILIGFGAEIVFLVIQNKKLQWQISQILKDYKPHSLQLGEQVNPIELISASGKTKTLRYGDNEPTLYHGGT